VRSTINVSEKQLTEKKGRVIKENEDSTEQEDYDEGRKER
jgi:hypothetical protein